MAYKVQYAAGVVKDLKNLPKQVKEKALHVVEAVLARIPTMGKPLSGPYKGLWKYRMGDFRIIYSIEQAQLVVFVLRVRHRKDVYQGIVF
ncbi:MAG: type II toxin-antitoxin system RelE/ParE family toxin [Deltaproteobacteria bacterium]|nr:type II toxin-antitoxin system RelE/ParE family toxin [Deltaproteobacteria bacterium]